MKSHDAIKYVAALKSKYPNPVRVGSRKIGNNCSYCVGGTLAKEHGDVWLFPDAEVLGAHIRRLVPRLTTEEAEERAGYVIEANDEGKFDRAWVYLASALITPEGTEP